MRYDQIASWPYFNPASARVLHGSSIVATRVWASRESVSTKYVQRLSNRHDAGTRVGRVLHDLPKEFWGAPVGGGFTRNVVSRENQPASHLAVAIYDLLYGCNIMSALLEEIARKLIYVSCSTVKDLAASATAPKTAGNPCLRQRPRRADWVGEGLELGTWNQLFECFLVLDDRFFKSPRVGLPRITVRKCVASQLVASFKDGPQVIRKEDLTSGCFLASKSKRRIIGPRQTKLVQDCTADEQGRPRKVIEGKRDQRTLQVDRKRLSK